MKRKFTRLTAALALLVGLAIPLGMWGQTTVTQTSFSAISGNVDNDTHVSYASYKGNGTSNPAVNSNAIRLYQSNNSTTGGYVVIGVANGYEITSATIRSTMTTTTGYKLTDSDPGSTTPAKNTFDVNDYSLSANTDYTVSGISTQYITFACFGTTSSSRLYLSKISVTYQSTSTGTTYTVTYKANGPEVDDIEDTYSEGADVTVRAANTFSNPGYAFTEWTTEADGSGDSYDPDDVIEDISADIDLYAQWEESDETTYDFTQIDGFSTWGNGYNDHEVEYSDATVTFYAASRQTGTITDRPVTKAGPVTLVMTDESTLNGVTFVLTQWTNKTKTVELHYSTDGGDHYTSTDITSSNFTITCNSLPEGTNAVKITFSETSNQVGIASATIVKNNVSDPRTPTTTSITAPDGFNTDIYVSTTAGTLTASVYAGETLLDGATVTWASSNTSVATVASNGVVTLVGVGEANITADYAGDETNYKPSQGVYPLTVTSSEPVPGTVNNPYTVAQAIANTPSSGNVYIQGIVSSFYNGSIMGDGSNFRYYISDDGTTTTQLLVYKGKGLNNEAFTSNNDLLVGDEVVICGSLITYQNAPEVAANNYIVSLVRPDHNVEAPTFSPAAGVYASAQTVTISCATDGASIFYTTDGSTPNSGSALYEGALTVATTTTIKAIAIKNNDLSTVTTATYHINSQASPYTVAQALAFNEYPANGIYVHGIVSTAPTQNPTNDGELSYYISDNGEANNQLQVYKGKGLNQAGFEAQDDIQVGDIVTIYGNVKIYNNTKEFDQGNYLVSFQRPEVPHINLVTIGSQDPYNSVYSCLPEGGYLAALDYNFEVTSGADFSIQYCNAQGESIADAPDWITVTVGGAPTWAAQNPQVSEYDTWLEFELSLNQGEERKAYFKVSANNGAVISELVTVTQQTVPSISAEDVPVGCDATSGAIEYTVNYPVTGGALTASTQSNWLTLGTVGETVPFTCTANADATARTATVTLTYTYTYNDNQYMATKDVTVTQAAPVAPFAGGTGTINFGSAAGSTNINSTNVTGNDNLGNTWTITTVFSGEQSFTSNPEYAQVGAAKKPASSITFTMSLPYAMTITNFEAKFGGFSETAGNIWLQVDGENVGTGGALNGTEDVTVTYDESIDGQTLTVVVDDIAKGVKCYYISYTCEPIAPAVPTVTVAQTNLELGAYAQEGTITVEYAHLGETILADVKYYESDGVTVVSNPETVYPWFAASISSTTNNVSYIVEENEGEESRSAYFKVWAYDEDMNEVYSDLVTVSQAAAPQQYTLEVTSVSNAEIVVFDATEPDETDWDYLFEGIDEVQVLEGTPIALSVSAEEGYALTSLTVNDVEHVNDIQGGVYTFTMPAEAVTITVTAVESVAPAGGDYVRITSLDQLTDGCKVIIAARYDGDHTNGYYAMPAETSGRPTGVLFTSETAGNDEILPATITASEDTYYWTVNVTNDGYTFTNNENNVIAYSGSGTEFGGNNTAWTITRETSEETAKVPGYTGFVIRNGNTNTRAIAFSSGNNNTVFGAYSTGNMTNSTYNFFLDFFVQTETVYLNNITGFNGEKDHYYLIASPVTVDPASVTGGMTEGNFDLYRFNESASAEWENWKDEDNFHFDLVPGKGYLYAKKATTETPTYNFTLTGIPYNGNGEVTLTKTEGAEFEGWNLIGNPFNAEATLNKAFYRMADGGAGLTAQIDANNTVNAMEGVFVEAVTNGATATFTAVAASEPELTEGVNAPAYLNLNISKNRGGFIDNAIVRFDGGAMLGKFQLFPNSTKVYITENGKDYAIVRAQSEGEMPVSFKAENNGTYTISVNAENVEMTYLHLIDNRTGADVDLLATPSYSFEARTTDYASRFRLVFNANDENGASTGSATFAYYNGSEWMINNMGEATLQVVDVMGRVLSTETVSGNATMNLNQTPGVYMLRLVNGDSVKVQKVVVR